MDPEEKAISKEQAATNLKEVYQKFEEDHKDQSTAAEHQPASDDIAKQIAGSDADTDHSVGYHNTTDTNEAAEQIKGSDADVDKPA